MKRVFWSLLLMAMFIPTSRAQSIDTLKWKNRILILMDSRGNTDIRNEQLTAFEGTDKEIKDRDLVFLIYDGKYLLDRQLKKTSYQLTSGMDTNFQGIILIGKDGRIKLREPFTIKPKVIFELIDSMPMRRAEMRKSGGN